MRYYFTVILCCFFGILSAQDTIQCISIDFESFPSGVMPFEGLPISEEYRDSFGLYFELEDGGFPVLAEVGPVFINGIATAAAFASVWGRDTPAPGVDIGQFFLTDDGVLSGLISPPIIVRFDNPIDTFSGCIMDMDFGEQFVIHARDIDDNIVLADTIRAGDPGTGDGQATCWGFNLPKCTGSVYSIRYEGTRPGTGGAFGMGLDNLAFCTGIDVNTQITSVTAEPTCDSLFTGVLEIINDGPGVFQYSINGSEFQDEPIFTGIPAGEHLVTFLESRGCVETLPFFIEGPQYLEFIDVGLQHTTCAEDNGSFAVQANLTDSILYSINGSPFQEQVFFGNLPPDTYTITAMDKYGCTFETVATIDPSTMPEIESVGVLEDACSDQVGEISVSGTLGTGTYEFSINNGPLQSTTLFSGLSGGDYLLSLRDSDGCEVSQMVNVPSTPEISNIRLAVDHPFCKEFNGAIKVSSQGGTGELSFSINGSIGQSDPVFENLAPGTYEIAITDELGCLRSALTELDVPLCPVWIPNVFSPNNDATNELFTIGTVDDYDLGIIDYFIYDRWGELVYIANNFSIYSNDYWWDGDFRGKPAEIGVYTYLIRVLHPNETIELFTGDVTLLR